MDAVRSHVEDLTKEHLLRTLIAWYGDPSNWRPPAFGSNISKKSTMERDGGRVARTAASTDTVGNLLKAVCDAHGIHLMELGRRAGVSDPEIGKIVRGSRPELGDSVRLREALARMIGRQNGG